MLIETVKPTSQTLEALKLKMGENDLSYRFSYAKGVFSQIKVKIFMYGPNSRLVISDIDGTITKSDILGYILPLLGYNYHFEGLMDLYNDIESNNYQFVYLTARSIHEYKATRSYIDGTREGSKRLPKGPILMYPKSLMGILKNDLITKRSDVILKADPSCINRG